MNLKEIELERAHRAQYELFLECYLHGLDYF
jgi:hypothetical protein